VFFPPKVLDIPKVHIHTVLAQSSASEKVMSKIVTVSIKSIKENPHRDLGTYPTIEKKVEALMRSFKDVGLWEGIIARQVGNKYELAFGHHRFEAAKRIGMKEIPLVVRDLSDEDMLKFMGRENGEDYSTEFLIMLNTWEGAVKFSAARPKKSHTIDIARILGWTEIQKDTATDQMNHVAKACASATALIHGGYLGRTDFEVLSVRAAQEIAARAHSRMDQIDKVAKATNRPKKEVDAAKKHVAKGAKITARESREGTVAQKDLRSQVDVNAFKAAATSKVKESPLFAVFGKGLADSIEKMLNTDKSSEKLNEIAKVVGDVTMEEDHAVLRQIDYQLSELGIRTESWKKRLIPNSVKVVGLRQLEKKS